MTTPTGEAGAASPRVAVDGLGMAVRCRRPSIDPSDVTTCTSLVASRLQAFSFERGECLMQTVHWSCSSSSALTSRCRRPPLQLRLSFCAAHWRHCD